MKYYLLFIFLVTGLLNTYSADQPRKEFVNIFQDSVITISGVIYDSLTREPISNATITYEKLPYGNSIGITHSQYNTGKYEFSTFGKDNYRIEVKAKNYKKIVDIIQPVKNASDNEFTKDYYLEYLPGEGSVIKLENLIFDLGKSVIKPDSYEELDRLVETMREYPEMVIQLEGHTDFRGGKSKNLKLSQDRVDEVKKYLVSKGIETDRILTRAFGGSQPVTRESSDEAAALNRRVEVRIIKR